MNQPEWLNTTRLFWVGPLTVLISVAAVLLIRLIAVKMLHPDADFLPLTLGRPILDTVIGATAAVFVFLKTFEYSLRPVSTYRTLAAGVLVLSFAPDVALGVLHLYGGNWPEAFALMSMHIVVWAICVTMLPALLAVKPAAAADSLVPPPRG